MAQKDNLYNRKFWKHLSSHLQLYDFVDCCLLELKSELVLILFIQVFNNSPDETAYFRMILNRENVSNSVVMVQPSLISYSFHSGPEPALLDVLSIAADKILLLDSYFTIVIFHGSTIAQWRKAGYHELPEHQVVLLLHGISCLFTYMYCNLTKLGTPEVMVTVSFSVGIYNMLRLYYNFLLIWWRINCWLR